MRDTAMVTMMLRNAHGFMDLLARLVHVTKRSMQCTEAQRGATQSSNQSMQESRVPCKGIKT